ncbi:MAG: carboxypeptidase regulatory-like domain-containing protein [Flavobacteriales bacterium]|nr:carboxypeptidase regulatory-like domain-containing protein [Flavobacteriales bacterium]
MADSRPQNTYPCSQADLYAVCRIGWNSFIENQPDFEALNTIYTPAYGTDAIAEIDAALNLPGFQERDEAQEVFHIQMKQTHAEAITRWKALRSYIKHAYPSELHKPKIESAGYDHYSKAANLNWAETQLLLVAGQHFIDNNTPDLTTGGMPATFAAEYATKSSDFLTLYDQFTDAEQDSQEGTDTKIEANNAIFKKLNSMFEDARIIYEHDPSKRERFVFTLVYALITRPSNGTSIPTDAIVFEGVVTDFATGLPVSNASINTTPDGSPETFSTVTDENGIYAIKVNGLAPNSTGILNVNAESIDHEPTSLPLDYETGNKYTLDFQLQELAPPPPPPVP